MTRRAPALDLPIQLDRKVPLHEALYRALRDAMLSGRLAPRSRMPASRDLAAQLAIARGTVVACYAQLASEGYLQGRAGSGTFVAEQLPDRYFAAQSGESARSRQNASSTRSSAESDTPRSGARSDIAAGRGARRSDAAGETPRSGPRSDIAAGRGARRSVAAGETPRSGPHSDVAEGRSAQRKHRGQQLSNPRALSEWAERLHTPFTLIGRRPARPFRAHIPAVDAFPIELWTRLLARRARRDETLHLAEADVRGYRPLREQLATHLRVARGLDCHVDQIVIVPSVQQVVDLVTRLCVEPGEPVWMEDPGYVGARAVFEAARVQIIPVPVDTHGIDVAAGIRLAPHARLAYVTPSHQAPLGATLPIDRRLALLAWAQANAAWVIEDDYDSEYRYRGRPVPALQSLDRNGVVIHTGSFSKTLLPSLRLGYAVLPEALVEPFVSAKSITDRFTPVLHQAALTDFIAAGHFGRHLRRMRELYAERRAALLEALERELGDTLEVAGSSAGLDLTVFLPPTCKEQRLVSALAEQGIEAHPLAPYSLRARPRPGLILGFAAFSPARLQRSAAVLARTIRANSV